MVLVAYSETMELVSTSDSLVAAEWSVVSCLSGSCSVTDDPGMGHLLSVHSK